MSDVLSLLKQWDNLLGEGGKQKIYALFIKEKESVKAKKNPRSRSPNRSLYTRHYSHVTVVKIIRLFKWSLKTLLKRYYNIHAFPSLLKSQFFLKRYIFSDIPTNRLAEFLELLWLYTRLPRKLDKVASQVVYNERF